MPYLGADTVVHDAHTLRSLVEVLQGSFQCVTVGELRAKGGTRQPHVADGLFAVPQRAPKRATPVKRKLPHGTKLLQVQAGDAASACYLLADEVRKVLNLNGKRAHLFEQLCTREHEHADGNLATHLAVIRREEEGYVLVNAHPAFADPVSATGRVNEPAYGQHRCLRLVGQRS